MRAQHLGGDILVTVGPLVEVAGVTWTQAADGDAPAFGDKILRQPKGSLRIAGQFVVTISSSIGTGFIEESRREGVILYPAVSRAKSLER
jgi:hypothetical protein